MRTLLPLLTAVLLLTTPLLAQPKVTPSNPSGPKVTPITVWILTSPAWNMCRTTDPSNPVLASTCEDCCGHHLDNGDLVPGSGPLGYEVCMRHCRSLPPVRYTVR